mmetsp:Transcript_44683/g.54692  ORF Transcript_44683/g.54692 Transcript_44683/m.54692 type:complete len:337 (+) Transcript_44683:56-1066(+)
MGGSQSQDGPPGQPSQPSQGAQASQTRGYAAQGEMVKLNVYSPSGGQHVAYHSGVEIFGGEYVFGGGDTSFSGVTVQRPKVPPPGSGWTFYQTVDIAPCRLSRDDAMRAIQELRSQFPASGYDLMARNCNHFSEALCQRLCSSGIPSWVNRLAGIGNAMRSAVGGAPTSTGPARAEGAGGPAAAGLVARTTDGDLTSEVDWKAAGVLNAVEDDPTEALQSKGVTSEAGSPELLVLLPFISPVKMQKLILEAPDKAQAPTSLRLFANNPNLDMDDAMTGAATQEFQDVSWTSKDGGLVATLDVNFLKFQKLSFLAIYARGEDDTTISIRKLSLSGRA